MKKLLALLLTAVMLTACAPVLGEGTETTNQAAVNAGITFEVNETVLSTILPFVTGASLTADQTALLTALLGMAENAGLSVTAQANGAVIALTLKDKPLLNAALLLDSTSAVLDTDAVPTYALDLSAGLSDIESIKTAISSCVGEFALSQTETLDGQPCASAPFTMSAGLAGTLLSGLIKNAVLFDGAFGLTAADKTGAAAETLNGLTQKYAAMAALLGTENDRAVATGTVLASADQKKSVATIDYSDADNLFLHIVVASEAKADNGTSLSVSLTAANALPENGDLTSVTPDNDLYAGGLTLQLNRAPGAFDLSLSLMANDIPFVLTAALTPDDQTGMTGTFAASLFIADTENAVLTASGKTILTQPAAIAVSADKTSLPLFGQMDQYTVGAFALDLTGDGLTLLFNRAYEAMPQETSVLAAALSQGTDAQATTQP